MTRQDLNQLLMRTIKELLIDNKKVMKALNIKPHKFYDWKKDYNDCVKTVKKGLVAESLLKDLKVPKDFLFKTPIPIHGDNERMIELYKLGLYSETLLKVDIFTALIKPDNKKD